MGRNETLLCQRALEEDMGPPTHDSDTQGHTNSSACAFSLHSEELLPLHSDCLHEWLIRTWDADTWSKEQLHRRGLEPTEKELPLNFEGVVTQGNVEVHWISENLEMAFPRDLFGRKPPSKCFVVELTMGNKSKVTDFNGFQITAGRCVV